MIPWSSRWKTVTWQVSKTSLRPGKWEETSGKSVSNQNLSDSWSGKPFEESVLEFDTRDVVQDPKPEEKDLSAAVKSDESHIPQKMTFLNDVCNKSSDFLKKLTNIPVILRISWVQWGWVGGGRLGESACLPEIFGDHTWLECGVNTVEDNETVNMIICN